MKTITILKLTIFQLLFYGFTSAQTPVIKTQNGLVSGSKINGINIFKGIPFASPPIGNLRWKAPQAPSNWQGIKQCNAFSASPMQNEPKPFMCWSEEFIAPPSPLSEDCLYLNIWSKSTNPKAKLPVFVWIYGGGFSSGSAACAIYDGAELAKKGIIFVSINYRVGIFGFMAHPELSQESPNRVSGNYGLLDQIEALKWVQKNITAFGGDPRNVTIAGQSAGSMSVCSLVASSLCKGLFQRAIEQSGGILTGRFSTQLTDAEKVGQNFQQKATAKNLAELRQISGDEIQKLSLSMNNFRFLPTLDDYVLPRDLIAHFKANKQNNVPIMAGWVMGDGALFGNQKVTAETFKEQATQKYGDKADEFLKIFPALNDDQATKNQGELALISFAALPAHLEAVYNKHKTYIYQFSHVPPDKANFPNYGAFHTSEVPYALHTLHEWKRDWQATDLDLENKMSSYWVNFVKTGNPNGKDLPEWKFYEKQAGNILELGEKIELKPAMMKAKFDFLENY